MRALLVCCVVALLAFSANAWWCTGHMTICQIAKNTMSADAVTKVEAVIANMSASGPFPEAPDLVEAGCWADDLKSMGLEPMASWHFINQPYDPSSFPIAKWPIQDENVASVIKQLEKTLDYKSNEWITNFAVSNLIHFFGDIHQPLHATEFFSAEFPKGDEGGNLFTVTIGPNTTRLHFIWDSICWQYTHEMARPLSTPNRQIIENFATKLMNTYTFTDEQKKVYNSTIMAEESFNDAVKYAYPTITQDCTISEAYIKQCIPVAEARVALAGYRLGNELEYIFGSWSKGNVREAGKKVLRRLLDAHINLHRVAKEKHSKIPHQQPV